MPKPLELRKVRRPIKSHGNKTLILSYALEDLIKKIDLPADIFKR